MRVIFLDVDGVLNKAGCKVKTPSGFYFVEDDKLLLLKELVEKTNAKIVLSSTWRQGWEDLNNGVDSIDSRDFVLLRDKLKEFDLDLYDYTSCPITSDRGSKIKEWLSKHFEEVDSILVLDDESNIKPFNKFFVRTSFSDGLKEKHVKKSVEVLLQDDFKEWARKKELFKEDTQWNMEI